jgi:hypothetical protein
MKLRAIRLPEKTLNAIEAAAQLRGFASTSVFIRYAIDQELAHGEDGLAGAEKRLGASLEQMRQDQYRLMRMQQAVFALLDTLTKTLLTCVPWSENPSWPFTIWWLMKGEEREFRLRPRKPPIPRPKDERLAWSIAFKTNALCTLQPGA